MIEDGKLNDIELDLVNLARLAVSQSNEDIRLLLARFIRKYRKVQPELALKLDQTLKNSQARSAGNSILRDQNGKSILPDSLEKSFPVDLDSRLSLIRVFKEKEEINTPILSEELSNSINSLIKERKERKLLDSHGISPSRSAIMVGPPGVGKTLSARWIAKSLGKDLWVLDLTAIMSSFLGKTGNNLRMALDHAKKNGAILLLDEIDAIAKRRNDETDVGEIKRLVTVILQEVDQWPDSSLLLAATNHPELIDPALWRRFDLVLKFEIPDKKIIDAGIKRFLGNTWEIFSPWEDVFNTLFARNSLSDVERAISSLKRRYLLEETTIESLVLNLMNQEGKGLERKSRFRLAIDLAKTKKYSHAQISHLTGIARETIRKHAGPSPLKGRGHK